MAGNYGSDPGNGSSPKRRVHVLKGLDTTGVSSLTKSASIAVGYGPGGNNEIYSGEIISLNPAGNWVKGQDTPGQTCYFAWANAADTDVRAAGKLTGLSCAGSYQIETPWYGAGTFTADLTLCKAKVNADSDEGSPYTGTLAADPLLGSLTPITDSGGDGADDEAQVVIAKVIKAITNLNDAAVPPYQSNEQGDSEVLTVITVQD